MCTPYTMHATTYVIQHYSYAYILSILYLRLLLNDERYVLNPPKQLQGLLRSTKAFSNAVNKTSSCLGMRTRPIKMVAVS